MSKRRKQEINMPLHRAKLSCRIGRDALDGVSTLPHGVTASEYAIYNMLHAIEDIAKAMETQNSKQEMDPK